MAEVIHDIGELLLKSVSKSSQQQQSQNGPTSGGELRSPMKVDAPIEEAVAEPTTTPAEDENAENAPPTSSQVCFSR